MKVVLDTNILISAVITTGVSHQVLVKAFEGEYELLISTDTIQEFLDTLLKYPDKFQISQDEVETEVETIEYYYGTTNNEPSSTTDYYPDDDKFLEVAVAGDADYIISGDSHLQDLETFEGIAIVNPQEFIEILENQ